jgi:UDP-glucose 4-epimerase
MGCPGHEIRVIGTRHGEKRCEALLSREERAMADDLGYYFRVSPDGRDLNYAKYFELGEERLSQSEDYNSSNAVQLDLAGMKKLLLKLDFIRGAIEGRMPLPAD